MLKVIEIVILVKMYQRSLKNITSGKKKTKQKHGSAVPIAVKSYVYLMAVTYV